MTQTIAALLDKDFDGNQLTVMYDEHLEHRINNGWRFDDTTEETQDQQIRYGVLLQDNHHLAVTLNWITEQCTQAFRFLTTNEGDKFVRNLYLVRLAVDDLFAGSFALGADGGVGGPDMLEDLLTETCGQIKREIAGRLRKDAAYTLEEAAALMDGYLYFATCGLVGNQMADLFYGNDVLIRGGRYTHPTTLINTGELNEELEAEAVVKVLEALL